MKTLSFTLRTVAGLLAVALQPALSATFVVTNNADSGDGSLRWALTQAAATPLTSDNINFNLPAGQLTISPLTNLPNVFYAIVDARTQPGYAGTPIVRLDGSSNTSVSTQRGFNIGNNGVVAGFSIVNFRDHGIVSIGSATGIAGTVGCYVGVQPDGVTAGPNGVGIWVNGLQSIIGGVGPTFRNVISGNTNAGIEIWTSGSDTQISNNYIGTTANGLAALPNGANGLKVSGSANLIGDVNVDERNIIAGNIGAGVYIQGANNSVLGNWIGLNAAGNALPNEYGVITFGSGTLIGDAVQPAGANVISGNSIAGLSLRSPDVTIQNNLIGTDAGGTLARPNANALSVGEGKVRIEGNVIAGNSAGIGINSALAEATIVGNRIGVTAADAKLSNGGYNIRVVTGKPGLIVIGAPGNGNRIGASGRGIYLDDSSEGVIIQSNFIGWIPAPSSKDIGHAQTAIYGGGRNHQIGGNTANKANVISKNGATAINLGGSGHRIQGNYIGTDAAGTAALGNRDGIDLGDANNVLVGGLNAGEGNVIRNNMDSGVRIRAQSVSVLSNRIYGNGLMAIDLIGLPDGPDANDADDHDAGANGLQNYPVIESASVSAGSTLIQARLRSLPNQSYKVQFYSAAACHSSGLGEGTTLLGTVDALTDATGNADVFFSGPSTAGPVTATATDSTGSTSEYGNCVALGAFTTGQFRLSHVLYYGYEDTGEMVVQVTRSAGTFGPASVTLGTLNDTAIAGVDYVATSTTLNFAAGDVTKVVRIPLLLDAVVEGNEYFFVKLSSPTAGATLGLAQATATIVNSDPLTIRVASSDISAIEPLSGQAMATFTVTMGPHSADRTISYLTEDLTATAGADYVATSGNLVFAAGETSKTISVPIKADNVSELPEHFVLRFTESEPDVYLADSFYYATIENTGGVEILFSNGFE